MANRKNDQGNEETRDSKNAASPAQKGPQRHAEGQHGEKTHSRFIDQLHETEPRESQSDRIERDRERLAEKGGRRLVEDREQHDEAEKNSEQLRSKE